MHHSHKFFVARTVFKPVADSKEGAVGQPPLLVSEFFSISRLFPYNRRVVK